MWTPCRYFMCDFRVVFRELEQVSVLRNQFARDKKKKTIGSHLKSLNILFNVTYCMTAAPWP